MAGQTVRAWTPQAHSILPLLLILQIVTLGYWQDGSDRANLIRTTHAITARTIVSLTFDDGYASVEAARKALDARQLHGTFYIPSGLIGQSGRLTLDEILAMQAEGHEIGGHTVNHLHLDSLDADEASRQICDDRVALLKAGLEVTSLAYPYAAYDPAVEQMAKQCGYNSARAEGGFVGTSSCPSGCPFAETIPPVDPYAIRTIDPVINQTLIDGIEAKVLAAEQHGGGWVPIVFHDVCDNCSSQAISVSDFTTFVSWLADQRPRGVQVATVGQVVGGQLLAPVSGPTDTRQNGTILNSSVETPLGDGKEGGAVDNGSECWERAGFGSNIAEWSRVHDAHTGDWAERVAVTSLQSGDQKLIVREDSGSCSPAVSPGETYTFGIWYKSTVPTRLVLFYRKANGVWQFWTESAESPPSTVWRQFVWQAPEIPDGATRLTFGLQVANIGTLTTDDYSMTELKSFPFARILVGVIAGLFLLPIAIFILFRTIRRRRRG